MKMLPPFAHHSPIRKPFLTILPLLMRSRLQKAKSSPQGFSLIEVLVAMMIIMIFVSITMQMLVVAAYARAKADRFDGAYNWMQEDYESILSKATQYEINANPYSTLCAATNSSNGLAATFIRDGTNGLGGASVTLGPRTFGGETYHLVRTADYTASIDPQRLVQLRYQLTPVGGGTATFDIPAEVVIYAGFRCPG